MLCTYQGKDIRVWGQGYPRHILEGLPSSISSKFPHMEYIKSMMKISLIFNILNVYCLDNLLIMSCGYIPLIGELK